jgi:hypothetical protein
MVEPVLAGVEAQEHHPRLDPAEPIMVNGRQTARTDVIGCSRSFFINEPALASSLSTP